MRKNRLLKQSLAFLLSLSISLGPCAPGSFPVYAETGGAEASVEILEVEDPGEETVPASDISVASSSDAQVDEDGFLLDGEVIDDGFDGTATASDADSDIQPESVLLDAELLEASGDTWYMDYEYELGNGIITLIEYKGGESDVIVPATAVIAGNNYSTVIGPACFRNKNAIVSIKFETGVKLSEDAKEMFFNCTKLSSIDLSGLDTSKVESMSLMFCACTGLTSINLSGLDTSQVTNMHGLFNDCSGLTSIDLSGLDTSQVTDMTDMFFGCSGLTSIDLSGLDMSKVTGMNYMFGNCSGLTSIDLSDLDTSQVTNMHGLFFGCSGLTSIDLSVLDTSKVGNMGNMFSGCSGLTSIDLSGLDTSKVTYMGNMFSGCSGLTSIDLSVLDTSQVVFMGNMFSGCSGLTSIDLSDLDTSQVTYMGFMFSGCSGLTSIDLSGFDTSKVTYTGEMFSDCTGLTSIDLSGFDSSHVSYMYGMFSGCSGLTSIDLSGFDMSQVAYARNMFSDCSILKSIKTPINLRCGIELPSKMYDESGNEYSSLPEGLSESITLRKRTAVNNVSLDQTNVKTEVGETLQLHAVVSPEDAYNKAVTWTSSDSSVASVDTNGLVTAKAAGTATITVTTEDGGKTASCTVTVQAAADPVEVFVKRLYTTCLGREADAGGLKHWTGLVKNGTEKGIKLAGDFVFSKEFTNKNYCNEHFVRQLYLALMGRDPAADPSGVNYWTGVLDKGTTREALLNKFTSTSEYKKLCADAGIELGNTISDTTYKGKEGIGTKPYGPCAVCGSRTKIVQFAEMMYTECLKRAADTSGLAYWSRGLYEQTITGKAILENFFLSSEIQNKHLSSREYVTRIYKVMLNRSPDSGGLNYWVGRLDSGSSPTAVIAGFIDSQEFTKICSDYGIRRK